MLSIFYQVRDAESTALGDRYHDPMHTSAKNSHQALLILCLQYFKFYIYVQVNKNLEK